MSRRATRLIRSLLGERASILPRGDAFTRGLALGALVGAAIAGSTLWNRIRVRRRTVDEA